MGYWEVATSARYFWVSGVSVWDAPHMEIRGHIEHTMHSSFHIMGKGKAECI